MDGTQAAEPGNLEEALKEFFTDLATLYHNDTRYAENVKDDLLRIAQGNIPNADIPVKTIHEIRAALSNIPYKDLETILKDGAEGLFPPSQPKQ